MNILKKHRNRADPSMIYLKSHITQTMNLNMHHSSIRAAKKFVKGKALIIVKDYDMKIPSKLINRILPTCKNISFHTLRQKCAL